jgi:hypothetical protein
MLSGLAGMAAFFIFQMSGHKSIHLEVFIGMIASILLGLGTFFIMLSFGLWV